jgi:nicotinamide-nucleotide amidase
MNELSELKRWLSDTRSLAVAESLTAGNVQTRIGAISGASAFFRGGVTAYSLSTKLCFLGVDRTEAESCDCVSETVAKQMARGATTMFGATIALATTGYAEAYPIGGVTEPFAWWALAEKRPDGRGWMERSGRIDCPGLAREAVQAAVADRVLAELLEHLRATDQAGS